MIANLFYLTGAFATVLGALHFFFPLLFDFDQAMPREGAPLRPFKLWFIRYATLRSDVRGLIWVMNHWSSFWILTCGLLDLFWTQWLPLSFGPLVCVWLALAWFVRAASQLYMGRRLGDWLILLGFASIGVLHLFVAALRTA